MDSLRGAAVPGKGDALVQRRGVLEDAALGKSGSAGLATPVRRRDARRESLACYPKLLTTRTSLQVTGRLGEAKRRRAPRDDYRAPDAALSLLAFYLLVAHDGESATSGWSSDHPLFSLRGRKLLKRRPLR